MNMNKRNTLLSGLTCWLMGACGSPPAAPNNPTWEADVYPILQGQCLHCHGATAKDNGLGLRFDFFDGGKCGDDLTVPSAAWTDVYRARIPATVEPQTLKDSEDDDRILKRYRPIMPPSPASLLEPWQVQTLRRWAEIEDTEEARGERLNNRRPRIRITSLPATVGESLEVSYVIEDRDGDPVFGKLTLNGSETPKVVNLDGTGSGNVKFEQVQADRGDELTLSAVLCDGWQRVSFSDLGKVEKE